MPLRRFGNEFDFFWWVSHSLNATLLDTPNDSGAS